MTDISISTGATKTYQSLAYAWEYMKCEYSLSMAFPAFNAWICECMTNCILD